MRPVYFASSHLPWLVKWSGRFLKLPRLTCLQPRLPQVGTLNNPVRMHSEIEQQALENGEVVQLGDVFEREVPNARVTEVQVDVIIGVTIHCKRISPLDD